MPIGISFYTFQAMSYLIDVYRGECKAQKDIYKLALYICLFPQLIAGPIVKYHDVAEQIDSREVNFEKVDIGVKRFIIGLAKNASSKYYGCNCRQNFCSGAGYIHSACRLDWELCIQSSALL